MGKLTLPDGTVYDTGEHVVKGARWDGQTVAGRIFKADGAQRKTWHVFYPADKADVAVAMDGHRDFAGKAAVEKAAHDYMLKHRKVGLMHADGTDGSGDLVESAIHHGPDWVMKAADDTEQHVVDGDWVGVIQWDGPTWERWEKGELRGVSPQGGALRAEASDEAVAGLRKGTPGTAEKGDAEITELVEFEVERVDGVVSPANGFPVLMMKGLGDPDGAAKAEAGDGGEPEAVPGKPCPTCGQTVSGSVVRAHVRRKKAARDAAKAAVREILKAVKDGKVDEAPDVKGGTEVLGQIADLIISEAQELKAGQAGEIHDIEQLAAAAELIWTWRTGEEAVGSGSVMPATALMQSALEETGYVVLPPGAAVKAKGVPSAVTQAMKDTFKANLADKDKNPTPHVSQTLHRCSQWAATGHYPTGMDYGDVRFMAQACVAELHKRDPKSQASMDGFPAAKSAAQAAPAVAKCQAEEEFAGAAAEAAKKKGAKGGAKKSQIAPEGESVDNAKRNDSLIAKAVEDAVTKAVKPLAREIADLKSARDQIAGELAKVKAQPVPGGPVLSANVQVRRPGDVARDDGLAAKAALMRQKAEEATAAGDRAGYLAYARELDKQAREAAASA